MRIYVGNLSWQTDDNELRDVFAAHGEVASVQIINDRETGRSRGFAFVEMATDEDAEKAVKELDQQDLGGRSLTVNEAKPKPDRPRGGGFGGGNRGERW